MNLPTAAPKSNNSTSVLSTTVEEGPNNKSPIGASSQSDYSGSSATGVTSPEFASHRDDNIGDFFGEEQRSISQEEKEGKSLDFFSEMENSMNQKESKKFEKFDSGSNNENGFESFVPEQNYFVSEFSPPPQSNNDESMSRQSGDNFSDSFFSETASNEERGAIQDATKSVQEMHLALLYLMSNPDEFKRALRSPPPENNIDMQKEIEKWMRIVYSQENIENIISRRKLPKVPLPYIVFSNDAEVVLPQAHTASQLFGVETVRGIELEAASSIPGLSMLFLRWLALMPSGDHINIIDPPGLTVMRISGGRYRVTAAHRVVWEWFNDFPPDALPTFANENPKSDNGNSDTQVEFGDLVSMTVVDVFETDKDGKLLSYCPTFDNRSVTKTNATRERISKESARIKKTVEPLNKAAKFIGKIGFKAALSSYDFVKKEVDRRSSQNAHPNPSRQTESNKSSPNNYQQRPRPPRSPHSMELSSSASNTMKDAHAQAQNIGHENNGNNSNNVRSEYYISDDETTQTTQVTR